MDRVKKGRVEEAEMKGVRWWVGIRFGKVVQIMIIF